MLSQNHFVFSLSYWTFWFKAWFKSINYCW